MTSKVVVEVDKSGEATCRATDEKIKKGHLRIGKQTYNRYFRKLKMYEWFSLHGAMELLRSGSLHVSSPEDMKGFASLKPKHKKQLEQAFSKAVKYAKQTAKAKGIPEWMQGEPLGKGVNRIEYARVDSPSPCFKCGQRINKGDVRIGCYMESSYYYGMQYKWMDLRCGKAVDRFSQLEGWDGMDYNVSYIVRKKTKEIMSDEEEEKLKALMEPVSVLQDLLIANVQDHQLYSLLFSNRIRASDLRISRDRYAMSKMIASSMVYGLCEDCPQCKSASLVSLAGRITCWGYMDGLTKCGYTSSLKSVKRYLFEIPSDLAARAWLQDWAESIPSHSLSLNPKIRLLADAPPPPSNMKKKKKALKAKKAAKKDEIALEIGEKKAQFPGFDIKFLYECKKKDLQSLAYMRGLETDGTMVFLRDSIMANMQQEFQKGSIFLEAMPNFQPSNYLLKELKKECMVRGIPKPHNSKALILRAIMDHHDRLPNMMEEVRAKANKRKRPGYDPISVRANKKLKAKHHHINPKSTPKSTVSEAKNHIKGSKAEVEESEIQTKTPTRKLLAKPEAGSAILEIHKKYPQRFKKNPVPRIVMSDDAQEVYHAVLTQVDLSTKMNRFYILQLIQTTSRKYDLFCHWGQTGSITKHASVYPWLDDFKVYSYYSRPKAIREFQRWFYNKTGNSWEFRNKFRQKPNKYFYGELSRKGNNAETVIKMNTGDTNARFAKCKLKDSVKSMVDFIFDEDSIIRAMAHSGVNTQDLPLGSITSSRIHEASKTLSEIENLLEEIKAERKGLKEDIVMSSSEKARIKMLSTKYYNLIPTVDTPLITRPEIIYEHAKVVDILSDIAIGQELQKPLAKSPSSSKSKLLPHPCDMKYDSLKCSMEPLKPGSQMWNLIQEYAENTSFREHFSKTYFEILQIFKIDREGSEARFACHNGLSNRKLLWHGTSVAAAAAIVSKGLRIMPNAGGRVGKGLYFASTFAKSYSYLYPSVNKEAVMFLVEVPLGVEKRIHRDSPKLTKAPKGFDSVVAQGRMQGDPKGDVEMVIESNIVVVPTGKPTEVRKLMSKSWFYDSEYLVYRESQCRLRYMLKLKMHEVDDEY